MNAIIVITVLLLGVLPAATSLRCHSCVSETSHLDCYQQRINEDCYRGEYRCARTSYRIGDQTNYFRGCLEKKYCDSTAVYCNTREGASFPKSRCFVDCCNGDLCNSSMRIKISAVFLLACLFVALLF